MKKRLRALTLLLLIIGPLFISGCWSLKEIEDLAIVTLLGVDKVEDSNNKGQELWQVSAKVLQPQSVGQQNGGNSGVSTSGGGTTTAKELLFQGTGATLQEAARNLMVRSPRFMFLSYVSGLIIGEKAAQEGVGQIVELQAHFYQFRLRTFVLVTPGKASEVLQSKSETDETLAQVVDGLEKKKVDRTGISYGVDANQFIQDLLSPDRDAVLSQINVVGPQEDPTVTVDQAVVIKGLGVFRGEKLVGWLNPKETFGYVVVRGVNGAMIPISIIEGDKAASYIIGKVTSKIKPIVEGDKISYRVMIKTWGEVDEVKGIQLNPGELIDIEQAAAASIKGCVMSTIDKSRQLDADILGFTQQLHRHNLRAWQKLGDAWRESFQQADIEVEVEANIIQTGKTGRTLKIKD